DFVPLPLSSSLFLCADLHRLCGSRRRLRPSSPPPRACPPVRVHPSVSTRPCLPRLFSPTPDTQSAKSHYVDKNGALSQHVRQNACFSSHCVWSWGSWSWSWGRKNSRGCTDVGGAIREGRVEYPQTGFT